MSYYEYDSIYESELEENDVLDNMLEACDYMLDTLSEGARRKFVKMQIDKSDRAEKEANYYDELSKNTPSNTIRDKMITKRDEAMAKKCSVDFTAKEYSGAYAGLYGDKKNGEKALRAYNAEKRPAKYKDKSGYDDAYKDNSEVLSMRRNASDRFKEKYNDHSKDVLAGKEPCYILKMKDKKESY